MPLPTNYPTTALLGMLSSSESNLESGEDYEQRIGKAAANVSSLGISKDPVGMLMSDDENVGMTVTIGDAEEVDVAAAAASSAGSGKTGEGNYGELVQKRGRGRPRKSDGPVVQVRCGGCGLEVWSGGVVNR